MKKIKIDLRGEVRFTVAAAVPVAVPDDITDDEIQALSPAHLELLAAAGEWVDENDNGILCSAGEVNDVELEQAEDEDPSYPDEPKATLTRAPHGKLVCRPHWDDLDLDQYYLQQVMTLSNDTQGGSRPASWQT